MGYPPGRFYLIHQVPEAGWVERYEALGQTRGKRDLEEKMTGTLGMCVHYEKRKGSSGRGKSGQ